MGEISFEEGRVSPDLKEFLKALMNAFILGPHFCSVIFFFYSLSEQTRRASSEEEKCPTGGESGGL